MTGKLLSFMQKKKKKKLPLEKSLTHKFIVIDFLVTLSVYSNEHMFEGISRGGGVYKKATLTTKIFLKSYPGPLSSEKMVEFFVKRPFWSFYDLLSIFLKI